MKNVTLMDGRLRTAGVLLIIALAVEVLCLLRPRPLSFVALIGLGGVLLAAGLVWYLLSLVSVGPRWNQGSEDR
jgi:hypothetical protein